MKTHTVRYIFALGFIVLVASACSVKKDKFVNRNYHALTTKYNVMYNGNLALDAGVNELKTTYSDNFWEVLPIERMQIIEPVFGQDSIPRNPNFKRAEDKAIKAIQKHSMNIGGTEKNPQMDEAYLLLGKSRYYEQRFVPALEALNYVLFKYPNSDRINEIKIWKEKTNIRLENNSLAITNLEKLLSEIEFDNQIVGDANAILAQAYLNENQPEKAVPALKTAREFTKSKEEKARYTFILGQLFEVQNQPDSAYKAYQRVIDMKRKSPRQYTIQAHIKQAQLGGLMQDTLLFVKKYQKLLKDRENRPYLDVLNHQMALFYEKQHDKVRAKKYYNISLKHKTNNVYLIASNYRNLAEMHFYDAKYATAGKYYDSTLVNLDPKTREHRLIKKKRLNLEDVIKFEAIAQNNDSILSLVTMSDAERVTFFEKHIERLKKEEERLKLQAEKQSRETPSGSGGGRPSIGGDDPVFSDNSLSRSSRVEMNRQPVSKAGGPSAGGASSFYFYNQNTVANGKNEFRKKWGNRELRDYWRLRDYTPTKVVEQEELVEEGEQVAEKVENPAYTTAFYINQIPTDPNAIAELWKDRNFAYYQLGIIYKDKFKEYKLAQDKLEGLLESNPEERLILPSMYNLYRIYQILGSDKTLAMKSKITSMYPESRYAQLINNPDSALTLEGTPDGVYKSMFRLYEKGEYRTLLSEIEILIDQYSGEDIISKLELLKANTIGNLEGIEAYSEALNYVALTYPNSEEGKEAENLLRTNIPKLQKMEFNKPATAWKLIHKTTTSTDLAKLNAILEKFLKDRPNEELKITIDSYTQNEDFVVIHNVSSEQRAKDFITLLEEYKDYKITEKFVPISSEDYKVVQVKKNFDLYLKTLKPIP